MEISARPTNWVKWKIRELIVEFRSGGVRKRSANGIELIPTIQLTRTNLYWSNVRRVKAPRYVKTFSSKCGWIFCRRWKIRKSSWNCSIERKLIKRHLSRLCWKGKALSALPFVSPRHPLQHRLEVFICFSQRQWKNPRFVVLEASQNNVDNFLALVMASGLATWSKYLNRVLLMKSKYFRCDWMKFANNRREKQQETAEWQW